MNGVIQILFFIALFGGLMALTARSQKKQQQRQQNLLNSIKEGDEVITIGGLYGVVENMDLEEKKVTLDIDGVYLTFEQGAIKRVLSAETAVAEVEASEKQTSIEE